MSTGYAITINGETHNQTEWCRKYNVCPSTVKSRMWRHNIPFEQALVMKKQQGHVRVVPPEVVGRKRIQPISGIKQNGAHGVKSAITENEQIRSMSACIW